MHDFAEVREEVREAVVAGIRMVLVLDFLLLKLLVQGGSAFLESVVIILAAIEIDG